MFKLLSFVYFIIGFFGIKIKIDNFVRIKCYLNFFFVFKVKLMYLMIIDFIVFNFVVLVY